MSIYQKQNNQWSLTKQEICGVVNYRRESVYNCFSYKKKVEGEASLPPDVVDPFVPHVDGSSCSSSSDSSFFSTDFFKMPKGRHSGRKRGQKRGRGSRESVESRRSGTSNISGVAFHKNTCILPPPNETCGSGGGGCMLYVLNMCSPGVLSREELDEQIYEVYKEKNNLKEWSPNRYDISWCGIPGETWHQDCISKALKKKYQDKYLWRKQKRSTIYERGHGKLYVHGLLNRLLWPNLDQDSNWQHTICVDTDTAKFYDINSAKGRWIKSWFLCSPEKRYMSEIWRVYKLEVY